MLRHTKKTVKEAVVTIGAPVPLREYDYNSAYPIVNVLKNMSYYAFAYQLACEEEDLNCTDNKDSYRK